MVTNNYLFSQLVSLICFDLSFPRVYPYIISLTVCRFVLCSFHKLNTRRIHALLTLAHLASSHMLLNLHSSSPLIRSWIVFPCISLITFVSVLSIICIVSTTTLFLLLSYIFVLLSDLFRYGFIMFNMHFKQKAQVYLRKTEGSPFHFIFLDEFEL